MGHLRDTYGYQTYDFIKGMVAGIECYAVWKDGEQVVGIMQTPLKKVVEEVKEELLEGYKGEG